MRLRLTLWFVFGVIVVAVAGAVATRALLGEQLRGELDYKLIQQLNHYQQVIGAAEDVVALAAATEAYLSGPQANPLRQGAYVFSLQTTDGTVVSNSGAIRLEDLPATRALLESGEPYLSNVTLDGQSYRAVGTRVVLDGKQVGAVEIAGSLSGH